MPATVIAAVLSYLLMLAAFLRPHQRRFHIPAMIAVILFDLGMPFYLYTHRDWWRRLIEHQEILSILVWMHFFLLIVMYALDAAQVYSARKLLRGDPEARGDHRAQGKALLLVRGLVILTGAALVEPAHG